ncbi:alpha/beta fold hydrolase [Herbiconiux moechotypicola]|uniref:Dienelactone hydrolase family protein n=1 Tax=Herbiconiux moechotypicola TaxID=637393 RepID=A0ABN3D8U1_9MICO|nr:alpha/beta fold hydrolase [Herbiconiux moechotypicola]MCS5728236.1 alpha/beta fold hydrolase [Herbiconiux moechotypicola]
MAALAVSHALTSWGEGTPGDAPVVVMMHGFGSNEADLAGLAPALPAGWAWASLRAPLPMGGPAFAWFPITTPGRPDPQTVIDATDAVSDWIAASLPATSRVVALGFSQGGLMASQLLRAAPRRVEAAVVLGGFVLDAELPGDAALAAERPPVFSGRGTADTVIAPDAVARTEAWLPGHSTLTERRYPGLGHGINPDELADVVAFLQQLPG